MPDDKRGRDKQARDADKRQRERAMNAALERADETEPEVDESELGEVVMELETLSFPASGSDIVDAVGDQAIEAPDGTYTVEELIADTDDELFESPEAVRVLVQRPTVAGTMKRIVEVTDSMQGVDLDGSQRQGYEKTLRALKAVTPHDDDSKSSETGLSSSCGPTARSRGPGRFAGELRSSVEPTGTRSATTSGSGSRSVSAGSGRRTPRAGPGPARRRARCSARGRR